MLGWVAALVWPTPNRATRELYVGLNAYRAIDDWSVSEYAGIKLVNANDYKNWQMSSLNNLIFMDSVIDDTLSNLQKQDPYWNSVNRDDFAGTLHVYWRNAGKWRLVAEHPDSVRAVEAVTAWQQVVVDTVHAAVTQSQEALLLELQLRSLAEQINMVSLNVAEINSYKASLLYWREVFYNADSNFVPEESEHWQIWEQAVAINEIVNLGELINSFPASDSPKQEYLVWLDQALLLLDQESDRQDVKYKELDEREQAVVAQFSRASEGSLGLSASLDVDKISDTRTLLNVTRPIGLLMLCGGFLGFFTWLGFWIGRISLRGKD
jgi:hypothetical protein